jgi:opacity protein-like surface antigen
VAVDRRTTPVFFLIAVLLAAQAQAQSRAMGSFQGLFTPHLGVSTGGDVTEARLTPGVSVAVHEQDGWGAELDFGHASDTEVGALVLDLTTYTVNASWIRPGGNIRPYGLGGIGVMQVNGCPSPCTRPATTYDLGWTAGGGVLARVSEWVAVRGDVRYFFASADHFDLGRPDNLNFWRVSLGVSLIWVIVP